MSTAMWVLSVSLSKMYEAKMGGKIPMLDGFVQLMKEDMMITKLVANGAKLDKEVFDILETPTV